MAKEPTHVAAEDAPDDVRPPEQGPPAIGGGLRHAVQHHRSRHVHHQPQDAHQDHAAGHADDAGQEGGGQHREAGKTEGKRGQHQLLKKCAISRSISAKVASSERPPVLICTS